MNSALAGTVAALLLAATPALAQHAAYPVPPPGQAVQVHPAGHAPAPQPEGRYELQTVQRWVEGSWEQVWVAPTCKEKHRRHFTVRRCREGHYRQQWREGYYANVQEWVWVPQQHEHRHWRHERRSEARVDVQVDPFAGAVFGGGVQGSAWVTPGSVSLDVYAGY